MSIPISRGERNVSVTNEELQRAAEAFYLFQTQGGYGSLAEATPTLRAYYHEQAEVAASVLRPSGSVLIGGTCAGCEHWGALKYRTHGICAKDDSPIKACVTRSDFTCALFQRQETP